MEEVVLEVENRRRIYAAVCKYPGIHLRELARTVGQRITLVDYHLVYLEKHDLVRSVQEGMYKRYYPKDPLGSDQRLDLFSAPDRAIVGLLRQPVPFRIVLLLAKSGTMTNKELTDALRKAPSTVSHHLNKLVDAGAVERVGGGAAGYRLADPKRMNRILVSFVPQPSSLVDGFMEIWDDLSL